MNLEIAPLRVEDRPAWEVLARGYKEFYKTPTTDREFATVWDRLMARTEVFGLGASHDGRLVGFAHYLYHTNAWTPRVCYLQDLFTDAALRGKGVARALINAVADEARRAGATRYYWLTHEENRVARTLYDKVSKYHGFIRYEYPL